MTTPKSFLLFTAVGLTYAGSAAATTLLLSDTFNAGTTPNINLNLGDRQSGTLATATYNNFTGNSSIYANQLSVASDSGVANTANLSADLAGPTVPGFVMTFDLANAGSDWVATYFSTANNGDARDSSRFGMHLHVDGAITAYGDSGIGQSTTQVTKGSIDAALGYSYIPGQMNSFRFIATPSDTINGSITGTYDFFINDVEILSNVDYSLQNGDVYWATRTTTNGVGVYDSMEIAIIPEPGTALLGGLGLLALLSRRR